MFDVPTLKLRNFALTVLLLLSCFTTIEGAAAPNTIISSSLPQSPAKQPKHAVGTSVLNALEGFGDQANAPPWAVMMQEMQRNITELQQNHAELQQNHTELQQYHDEMQLKVRIMYMQVRELRLRSSDEGHAPHLGVGS